METKFLTMTINNLDTKAYTDILNTVIIESEIKNEKLNNITAASQYKYVSEAINSSEPKKRGMKKSLKELMQQSFFHGKSWMGENFIA
jgi:hypothetical protein